MYTRGQAPDLKAGCFINWHTIIFFLNNEKEIQQLFQNIKAVKAKGFKHNYVELHTRAIIHCFSFCIKPSKYFYTISQVVTYKRSSIIIYVGVINHFSYNSIY